MRGRLYAVVAVSLVALTVVPASASADFHEACDPLVAAYANVDLRTDPFYPGTFQYRGLVYCPGAEVTITELELLDLPDYGVPTQVDNTTAPPCSSTTTGICSVSDTADARPGEYEVRMTFDVDDPATDGIDFENVTRSAVFRYLGSGQPVPVCVSAGAVPVRVGACTG